MVDTAASGVSNADIQDEAASSVDELPSSPALRAFLAGFDDIAAQGWVPTLRAGSTGVGYTLETMLDIAENNSPLGDFMGMELKAYRDDDVGLNDSEKMNLFLKEPTWTDNLRHADRIRRYGYQDPNGRLAMYSTVKSRTNSHGFQLVSDRQRERVYLQNGGQGIAYWTFDVLAKRLREKHSEVVFVAAHARGKGRSEEFQYYSVTWCQDPDVSEFVNLIEAGEVVLELRMHMKPGGSVRNHGSAFRIKQNQIPQLFARVEQVRP